MRESYSTGTGGTFFQNDNDFYAGFKQLVAVPEVAYVLGFTPQDLRPNGGFHKLKITVKDKSGLKVQAREGYYAPKQALDPAMRAKEMVQNPVFSRGEIRDIPMDGKSSRHPRQAAPPRSLW